MPGSEPEVLDVPYENKGNVKNSGKASVRVALTCVLASIKSPFSRPSRSLSGYRSGLRGRAHEEGLT